MKAITLLPRFCGAVFVVAVAKVVNSAFFVVESTLAVLLVSR